VTFTYRIIDSAIPGGSATANVTIIIIAPQRPSGQGPPTANPDKYTAKPGQVLVVPAGAGGILANDATPNGPPGEHHHPARQQGAPITQLASRGLRRQSAWASVFFDGHESCCSPGPLPLPSAPQPPTPTPNPAAKIVVTGIARPPAEGTILEWNPDGSFKWQPPPNFSGKTTFEYT
jgi:hypothetical protein